MLILRRSPETTDRLTFLPKEEIIQQSELNNKHTLIFVKAIFSNLTTWMLLPCLPHVFCTSYSKLLRPFSGFWCAEGNKLQLEKIGLTNSSFNHSVIFKKKTGKNWPCFVFPFRESLVWHTNWDQLSLPFTSDCWLLLEFNYCIEIVLVAVTVSTDLHIFCHNYFCLS